MFPFFFKFLKEFHKKKNFVHKNYTSTFNFIRFRFPLPAKKYSKNKKKFNKNGLELADLEVGVRILINFIPFLSLLIKLTLQPYPYSVSKKSLTCPVRIG